jgi:hypothetical protein
MEKYYLNFSNLSGNWLVKKVGEGEDAGKIIQIFSDKKKAEEFINQLNKNENKR